MPSNPKTPRGRGLNPFEKAEQTTREAKSLADADLQAARKKTAGLREQRLAKEAADRQTELDKKPVKKPPRKKG
jgi:hypothetical protein